MGSGPRGFFVMRTNMLTLVALAGLCAFVSASQVPQVPRDKVFNQELERARRHFEVGWSLYRHEDWNGAIKEFQQTVSIAPKFAEAYYAIGRSEMALRHFARAIDAYTRCRQLYVESTGDSLMNQVGGTRRLDDQILELRLALQQAQQQQVNTSKSQTGSLAIRELQNKIANLEGVRDRNQNLVVDTSVPFYVPLSLGAAYFRSERFADAEREFKTAIEANGKSGEAHNNLAVLYMTTGRVDEASVEVKLAEKTGYKVNPQFKEDLAAKRRH